MKQLKTEVVNWKKKKKNKNKTLKGQDGFEQEAKQLPLVFCPLFVDVLPCRLPNQKDFLRTFDVIVGLTRSSLTVSAAFLDVRNKSSADPQSLVLRAMQVGHICCLAWW